MRKKITRRAFWSMLLALPLPARAQQAKKVPRIGYLSATTPDAQSARTEAFRQGLRDLGYVEGKNIIIEYRWADGKAERLLDLAAELVRLKVDVIVTAASSSARAAQKATRTIPIVFATYSDPVADGMIGSLARPGGNITGLSTLSPELSGKRLELLKEAVPKATRVAVFFNPENISNAPRWKEMEVVGRFLGVKLQRLEVRAPEDFEKAFKAATKEGARALIVFRQFVIVTHRDRIINFAAKNKLPAMYDYRELVEAGGLMSYGPSLPDLHRRAAVYVDKILKGRTPADLPVEQPMKFEFVINLIAAKQIGLTIPPNVLVRADKVIR